MGKRELVALLNLTSWCLVIVEWLFLTVPRGCLRLRIVVFPEHTDLLFLNSFNASYAPLPASLEKIINAALAFLLERIGNTSAAEPC